MWLKHPEAQLVAFVRGELDAAESEAVDQHLRRCARCRGSADAFVRLIEELGKSIPQPPRIDWIRYRAELKSKLGASEGGPRTARRWLLQPRIASAMALSFSAAALLAFFALRGDFGPAHPAPALAPWQGAMIGSNLDLLNNYPVVERLDLLENLDLIEHLDELSSGARGADGQQSLMDHNRAGRGRALAARPRAGPAEAA